MNKYAAQQTPATMHPSTPVLAIGVWLLILLFLAGEAIAQPKVKPRPSGYLVRTTPRFQLEESTEAKRPIVPLPPLPVVYNPQPRRSGQASLPATQTAAKGEFRTESNTLLLPGQAIGGLTPGMPLTPAPLIPQQSMFNPQSILRYFTVPAGSGNGTIIIDGPSLYQPTPIITGSKAVYERK